MHLKNRRQFLPTANISRYFRTGMVTKHVFVSLQQHEHKNYTIQAKDIQSTVIFGKGHITLGLRDGGTIRTLETAQFFGR